MNGGGIGIAGALFIIFLVLKLTHIIDWSWLWVLSPLWIPVAVVVAVLFGIAGIAGVGLSRKGKK